MRWIMLCLLCLNLACHFKTWEDVSRLWQKVHYETTFLDAGARINDKYMLHRLEQLESKIDNLSKSM